MEQYHIGDPNFQLQINGGTSLLVANGYNDFETFCRHAQQLATGLGFVSPAQSGQVPLPLTVDHEQPEITGDRASSHPPVDQCKQLGRDVDTNEKHVISKLAELPRPPEQQYLPLEPLECSRSCEGAG